MEIIQLTITISIPWESAFLLQQNKNRIHPGRVGQDGNGIRGPGDGGVTFRKISIEKEPG